ncbi:hypothetical protein SH661x_000969 [Planctomicrobium sp. SH661]|uniref:hypothetical protein n=1 Tax=Planctomicrobium sp. SH661 TaxID=3448124 RepID=UPI003F5B843B
MAFTVGEAAVGHLGHSRISGNPFLKRKSLVQAEYLLQPTSLALVRSRGQRKLSDSFSVHLVTCGLVLAAE